MRIPIRKYVIAGALGIGAAGAAITGMSLSGAPAHAQITVFDPSNYSQNLLTAARTLQQINNQIQSLQNQATMLLNQSRNLSRVNFPELDSLRQTMQQIDVLMGQAQGINFRVDGLAFLKSYRCPTILDGNTHRLIVDYLDSDERCRIDWMQIGREQSAKIITIHTSRHKHLA